jgi:hypothetical protein
VPYHFFGFPTETANVFAAVKPTQFCKLSGFVIGVLPEGQLQSISDTIIARSLR